MSRPQVLQGLLGKLCLLPLKVLGGMFEFYVRESQMVDL